MAIPKTDTTKDMNWLDEYGQDKVKKATEKGWNIPTLNPDSAYSGSPETKQERDWIANFVIENGRLPADVEMSGWSRQQSAMKPEDYWGQEFLPGSTAYEMGLRTNEDLRNRNMMGGGETSYGPYAGALTPNFGSVVLTDQYGKPLFRTGQESDIAQGYLNKGQYIRNASDRSMDYGQFPQGFNPQPGLSDTSLNERFYRELPQSRAYQPPDFETAKKGVDPYQFYQMQLSDLLQGRLRDDLPRLEALTPEIDSLSSQITEAQKEFKTRLQTATKEYKDKTGEELPPPPFANVPFEQVSDPTQQQIMAQSESQYYNKLGLGLAYSKLKSMTSKLNELNAEAEGLLDPQSVEGILKQAQYYASMGMPFEQLPYYQDATGVGMKGPSTLKWYTDLVNKSRSDWETALGQGQTQGVTSMPGGGASQGIAQGTARQQRGTQEQPAMPQVQVTGKEKVDYLDFVKKTGFSYNAQGWLLDNFSELVARWQAYGRDNQPFMNFVQDYLANGGMEQDYYSLPGFAQGLNPKRYAPPVYSR